MGNYHGRYSFETFTHKKAVLHRGFSSIAEKLSSARYPPYTENKQKFFTFVLRSIHCFNLTCGPVMTHVAAVLFGVGLTLAYESIF